MKTFADFARDAAARTVLRRECAHQVASGQVDSLHGWFADQGYDVPELECSGLIQARASLHRELQAPRGGPAPEKSD